MNQQEEQARKEVVALLEEGGIRYNEFLIKAFTIKLMQYYHQGGIAALDTAIERIGAK